MRPLESVAIGLLQGPAELLPVSSSAHVGLLLDRWGVVGSGRKELEVAVHAGTAVALAASERRQPRWALLAAATAPPALVGLAFERAIEEHLGTPRSIAAGLIAGSVAMVLADRRPQLRAGDEATAADGAWLGAAQALALIPGVSRSGAALAAARARGFKRADAAALSREVALPVLLGAAALKALRLAGRRPGSEAIAAGAAAVSTAAALRFERAALPLKAWAAYRTALAVVIVWQDRRR
jgi:undecaprenyl-diphosphatase